LCSTLCVFLISLFHWEHGLQGRNSGEYLFSFSWICGLSHHAFEILQIIYTIDLKWGPIQTKLHSSFNFNRNNLDPHVTMVYNLKIKCNL
jgi:hypothetical protein